MMQDIQYIILCIIWTEMFRYSIVCWYSRIFTETYIIFKLQYMLTVYLDTTSPTVHVYKVSLMKCSSDL